MIVLCSNCSTRLQLDDTKIPTRPFTVRCPKCQNIIQAQPPAAPAEPSALSLGETPSLENRRYKPQAAAPAFMPEKAAAAAEEVQGYGNQGQAAPTDLAAALLELLQKGGAAAPAKTPTSSRLKWERRRALVCVSPPRREALGRALVNADYQVYIAEDTSQAIERMREDQMDVIVLEADFNPVEQGAAFVTSEINVLSPAKRRRLVFVHLSPSARTLDSHAAFVQNVNLIVNTADIENLPQVLERTMRDFNDLYRDFNAAINVAAI